MPYNTTNTDPIVHQSPDDECDDMTCPCHGLSMVEQNARAFLAEFPEIASLADD